MNRHAQRLALAVHKAAAEQKVGAQDWQHQLHQLFIGDNVFAGALERAQSRDQLFVGLGDRVFADVAAHRARSGRGKQRQRRGQTSLTQRMRQLEGQQPAQTVTEQRIRFVQFGADLVSQVVGQSHDVGLQHFVHAHAATGKLQRAHVQPLGQFAPPRAVEHRAGAGERQAEQRQAHGRAHIETVRWWARV